MTVPLAGVGARRLACDVFAEESKMAENPHSHIAELWRTPGHPRCHHCDWQHGHDACAAEMKARAEKNQRLWDLVRYQRSELHTVGLITDDEYAELAQDHPAVKRLEDYDVVVMLLKEQLDPSPCGKSFHLIANCVDGVCRLCHSSEA